MTVPGGCGLRYTRHCSGWSRVNEDLRLVTGGRASQECCVNRMICNCRVLVTEIKLRSVIKFQFLNTRKIENNEDKISL